MLACLTKRPTSWYTISHQRPTSTVRKAHRVMAHSDGRVKRGPLSDRSFVSGDRMMIEPQGSRYRVSVTKYDGSNVIVYAEAAEDGAEIAHLLLAEGRDGVWTVHNVRRDEETGYLTSWHTDGHAIRWQAVDSEPSPVKPALLGAA